MDNPLQNEHTHSTLSSPFLLELEAWGTWDWLVPAGPDSGGGLSESFPESPGPELSLEIMVSITLYKIIENILTSPSARSRQVVFFYFLPERLEVGLLLHWQVLGRWVALFRVHSSLNLKSATSDGPLLLCYHRGCCKTWVLPHCLEVEGVGFRENCHDVGFRGLGLFVLWAREQQVWSQQQQEWIRQNVWYGPWWKKKWKSNLKFGDQRKICVEVRTSLKKMETWVDEFYTQVHTPDSMTTDRTPERSGSVRRTWSCINTASALQSSNSESPILYHVVLQPTKMRDDVAVPVPLLHHRKRLVSGRNAGTAGRQPNPTRKVSVAL